MQTRHIAVIVGIVAGVGIGVGVLIGYFSAPTNSYTNPEARAADKTAGDRILNEINNENIRDNLRLFAGDPHMAGTSADREGAERIRKMWLDQGLDSAKLVPYKVYLQHPPSSAVEEKANKVQVLDPDTKDVAFTTALREDPFGEEELLRDDIPAPFNAFSATGDVMGELVYVNYGRAEDYEYIQNELDPSMNFTGRIAISRHGGTGWYDKAMTATRFGIVSLLMYTDPANYAINPSIALPYPNGKSLPSTSCQRGGVKKDIGDALTPGYPAKEFAYRRPVEEAELPQIPIHPISYGDAEKLLKEMGGATPEMEWRGGLDTTYRVGPGFKSDSQFYGKTTRVLVNSESDQFLTYNVVGFIRGEIEPDRYVMIGNHRDAWGLGSVDPTSGTAAIMEISRAFGQLKKEGWRPRRTMVFCSWGAEEYGLIGSIEWTEEFNKILTDRAVAYLNLDMAVVDTYYLRTSATPHLRPIWYEATQKVPDPDPSDTRKTVYDTMKERYPDPDDPTRPRVLRIGGGSDYHGFEKRLGVPCIMGYYFYDYETYNINFYSLYHTSYETVRLMETFLDPEYKYHQAIARSFAEMTRILSESVVLPLDIRPYASDLNGMWLNLKDSSQAQSIEAKGISLDPLETAVSQFTAIADEFMGRVESVDTESIVAVRLINDQMTLLDKAFLGELPGDRLDKHLLFSSRSTRARSTDTDVLSGTFPGIIDALHEVGDDWRAVKEQVARITHAIEAANAILSDVTSW